MMRLPAVRPRGSSYENTAINVTAPNGSHTASTNGNSNGNKRSPMATMIMIGLALTIALWLISQRRQTVIRTGSITMDHNNNGARARNNLASLDRDHNTEQQQQLNGALCASVLDDVTPLDWVTRVTADIERSITDLPALRVATLNLPLHDSARWQNWTHTLNGVFIPYSDVIATGTPIPCGNQAIIQPLNMLPSNDTSESEFEWLSPYHENHATGWSPPVDHAAALQQRTNVIILQLDCSATRLNHTADGALSPLQRPTVMLQHLKLLHYAAGLATAHTKEDGFDERDAYVHVIIHGCMKDDYRPHPLNGILTCSEERHHWPSLHVRHWMISRSLLLHRTRIGLRSVSVHVLDDNDKRPWPTTRHNNRYAYAAVMHSSDSFLCGALVLAHSLRQTKTTIPLVIIVSPEVSQSARVSLEAAGYRVFEMERLRNPAIDKQRQAAEAAGIKWHKPYNEWNYSKLRLWQLPYERVLAIDSDIVVKTNLDHLFALPAVAASHNGFPTYSYNTGLFVLEPSNCTLNDMISRFNTIASYNRGDQGFVNEYFPSYSRLPSAYNVVKHFNGNANDIAYKALLVKNGAMALHFLGGKPWSCYRDFDCNICYKGRERFADETFMNEWWKVYDVMPANQQQYCALSASDHKSLQKQRFKWPSHITTIKDPRAAALIAADAAAPPPATKGNSNKKKLF